LWCRRPRLQVMCTGEDARSTKWVLTFHKMGADVLATMLSPSYQILIVFDTTFC
jgi:hypothetical protein